MVFAYAAALLCAVCYGLASVLQSIGARRVEASEAIDARSLARIATQLPYLIGLGLDGTAWLLSLLALAQLPLFVVQAMVAGAIGFTVLFAALFQHLRPTARQIAFIVVLALGLLGLALSGAPEEARRTSPAYAWGMWAGVIAIALIGALVAKKMRGDRAAAALGCLSARIWRNGTVCSRACCRCLDFGSSRSIAVGNVGLWGARADLLRLGVAARLGHRRDGVVVYGGNGGALNYRTDDSRRQRQARVCAYCRNFVCRHNRRCGRADVGLTANGVTPPPSYKTVSR